jgi:hypothetical protein
VGASCGGGLALDLDEAGEPRDVEHPADGRAAATQAQVVAGAARLERGVGQDACGGEVERRDTGEVDDEVLLEPGEVLVDGAALRSTTTSPSWEPSRSYSALRTSMVLRTSKSPVRTSACPS